MHLFHENTICLDLKATEKEAVIAEMVAMLSADGILRDAEAYQKAVLDREAQTTTGIGFGIAIPHAKSAAVNTARVAFGRSKAGIDYKSDDGSLANLVFMIAAPEAADDTHLKMLARLSRKLIDPVFRNQLLNCETKSGVMDLLLKI